jgi:hypothetical protein
MELPTVGRYENSPKSFIAVAVPKVPSGLFLSHEVRSIVYVYNAIEEVAV